MKKRKKSPVFSKLAAVYFDLMSAKSVAFKRGLTGKKDYLCKQFPDLVGVFGWEGDVDAPIAYIDGSYYLRGNGNRFITFGVSGITEKVRWYNKEGWLPCLVSEFKKDGVEYIVENFADKVEFGNLDFEIAYSRLTVKNKTVSEISLPKPSSVLVLLNECKANILYSGETAVLEYAIGADRFGKKVCFPNADEIRAKGSYDKHYEHMKSYWTERVSHLAQITKLHDERLIDACKAGYIYTMIVKDGDELHVGENGYDRVFDHDVIGILAYLVTIGDFKYFQRYAKHILMNVQYPDARWKYSWVFALYLLKTGNAEYVKSVFEEIKENTHYIEKERADNGIMRRTNAIDSNGFWTIDNWSALMGLTSYKYICEILGKKPEAEWAATQYDTLISAVNKKLEETAHKFNLNYMPISMTEPNETGARNDPRDANWASMFLFGRWAWDGYLFGGEQYGFMLDMIDKTYTHGFERRTDISDTIYNFGGYPHGYFCSAYNAGYGSAALRGEKYRSAGIKAYQFMIDKAQSAPFSWWEGVKHPSAGSPWDIDHAAGGGGSCPHIWGQATATKVLFDSLIAEKSDGTLIIGRGLPSEWIADGEETEVINYPVSGNRRVGFNLKTVGNKLTLRVMGEFDGIVSLELDGLKGRIADVTDCEYDNEKGTVILQIGIKETTITIK